MYQAEIAVAARRRCRPAAAQPCGSAALRLCGSAMALILCVMLPGGVVLAAEQADEVPAGDGLAAQQAELERLRGGGIDEIVVTAPRNLRNLVALAGRLTLNFYDLLNDTIDDPDFRITCANESSAGTRIRRLVCRPHYVRNEQAIVARQEVRQRRNFEMAGEGAFIAPGDFDAPDSRGGPRWQMQLEFNDSLLRAVNEDPVLNRAFWELYELKEEIDRLRAAD